MSKPQPQTSILTWVLAAVGICLWAVGTMGWVSDALLHPIGYAFILAAAVTADPLAGRSVGSNLQLTYTVVAWLMVALIAVTEGLSLGGILFFGLISLTMTIMYFHPSFRLRTRVSLYMCLLILVWAPALYGILSPDSADAQFGLGARTALIVVALGASLLFFGFAFRWITVAKREGD